MRSTRPALRHPSRPRAGAVSLPDSYSARLLLPVSIAGIAATLWTGLMGSGTGFDFHYAYWLAGHRVLSGSSPWAWTHAQFLERIAFVYPALSALMFAPLSLIGRNEATLLFSLVCIALVPATLWMLNVRDRRVYAITMLWLPVYGAWQTVNETLFLTFGLACLWRWRNRPLIAGVLVGSMLSLKPFMWPFAIWLLATRRWHACAYALATALLANLIAWSVVGFAQIATFLHAARADTADSWRTGFGIPALLGHFGLGFQPGLIAMVVLSLVLVGAIAAAGLGARNEVRALVLAVALAMVSSPLLWSHYATLLIVPLAVLRPRFAPIWMVPLLLWVCPLGWTVHLWQWVFAWATVGGMLVALVRQPVPVTGETAHAGGASSSGASSGGASSGGALLQGRVAA